MSEKSAKPLTMSQSLINLFESGQFSDVIFVVNGVKIPGHRNILAARSEYFNAMFGKSFKESKIKTINISDANPEIFKAMLKFLQTDIFPGHFDLESLESLFTLADRYGIEELMNRCERDLISIIELENYGHILQLSETFSRENLKECVILFIKNNYKAVIQGEQWQNFKQTHPVLVYEVSEAINLLFVDEEEYSFNESRGYAF